MKKLIFASIIALFTCFITFAQGAWTSSGCSGATPSLKMILIDGCGDEGSTEYLVFKTGTSSYSPGGMTLTGSAGGGTPVTSNNFNGANAAGIVASLNGFVGACTPTVFVAAPANIPPNSTVWAYPSSVGLASLGAVNLPTYCGQGPIYVISGSYAGGASGFYTNGNGSTGLKTCIVDFGGCVTTATYTNGGGSGFPNGNGNNLTQATPGGTTSQYNQPPTPDCFPPVTPPCGTYTSTLGNASPPTPSICAGQQPNVGIGFSLSGANMPPYTIVLQPSGGGTPISITSNATGTFTNIQLPAITATTTYTYTSVVNGSGCPGMVSGSITITVNNTPPTINVVNNCASSVLSVAPAFSSYVWSNAAGNVQSQTVTTSATYSVTATATGGCTFTASANVNVVANTLNLTPLPNITVCPGTASVPLSVPGAPTPATYNWSGPGLSSTTSATPTINSPVVGTNTYNVTVTNSVGCTWTNSFTINVLPPLTPIVNTPVVVCAGQTITLTTTGLSPAPAFYPPGTTFTWTKVVGNTVVGNTQTVSILNATAAMAGAYTVTASYPLASTCTTLPATVNVTVTPNTTLALAPVTVCQNAGDQDLFTLFPSATAGGTWSGSGVTGSTFNPSGQAGSTPITFTPPVGGCATPANTTITVNPVQVIALSTPPILCSTDLPFNLNTLLPVGVPTTGTWSGVGVTSPNFNPTGLSGSTPVTYTPPLPNNSCYNSPSISIQITAPTSPTLNTATTCATTTNFDLNTLFNSPIVPGVWSGPGVTSTTFNATAPGVVSPANITFTPSGTCTTPKTTTITITPVVPIVATPKTVCANDPAFNLNTLITPTPAGTWTGSTAISGGNTFTPTSSPTGIQNITFTPSGSCGSPVITTVTVNPIQTINLTQPAAICQTATLPLDLTTLLPVGAPAGTWSGTGVSGTNFSPNGLTGTITLTFAPNAPNTGCYAVATTTILVNPPTQVGLQSTSICQNVASLDLNSLLPTPNPLGAWSGPGVTTPSFNPNSQAGQVIVTFTPSAACTNTSTATITVNVPSSFTLLPVATCSNSSAVTLNTYLPVGAPAGTWSGSGVTGGTTFTPSAALVGANILTYTPVAGTCALVSNLTIGVTLIKQPVLQPGITVCQTQGSINLNNYLDPLFPTGTWSGQGVSGTNFNPSGLNGNIILTFTPSNAPCAQTATTTFLVTTAQTPNLGTTTLCKTAGAINLLSLIDSNFPTGTWSGAGTYFTGGNYYFDPSAQSGTVLLTFTPTTGCANSANATVIVTPLKTPVLKNQTLCISQTTPFDLTTLEDPMFLGGTWSGSGVTGTNFSTVGQSIGTVQLTYTPLVSQCAMNATATITLTGSITPTLKPATICQNNTALNLSTLNTSVYPNGTWSGTGVSGNNFTPTGLAGSYTLTFTPTGYTCVNAATTPILVSSPIGFGNLKEDCQSNATQYIVSFDISGGIAPYIVTGGTGTLTGTTFTSALINVGTAYNFIVNDASGCNPLIVSGLQANCGCVTKAGTMILTPRTACASDTICAVHNGNQTLQADDMLQFILHDKSGLTYGNIFATANTPCFGFKAPMKTGVTYYISAIAGNKVANNVDLTDPCLKVAQGTPVKWLDIPTATFVKDTTICAGDSTFLVVNLKGDPLWNLNYTENGTPKTITGINTSPYYLKVKQSAASTYIITKVNSNGLCPNTTTSTAKVLVKALPTLAISKDTSVCDGQVVKVNTKFTNGTGTFFWAASANTPVNTPTSSVLTFTPTQSETVKVTGTQNGCSSTVSMKVNVDAPITVSIDKSQVICEGDPATLVASGASTYLWSPSAQTTSAITVKPTKPTKYSVIGKQGSCTATDTATVTVINKMIVTAKDSCLANNSQYITVLTITGGKSPYTITGGTGNVFGNKYYSNPQALGANYSLTIKDASACNTATISGVLNTCKCDAVAGTMKLDTLFACTGDLVTAISLKDYVLGKKDTIQYILHDTPLAQKGNILATSYLPQFTLSNIPGVVPNKVYYISTIVGAKDNAGAVNLADGCLSIALGQPAVLKNSPSVTLTGSGAVCSGSALKLNLIVTGALPITVNYTVNSAINALSITSLPYNFTVTPTSNSTYKLTSISDKYCTGKVTGTALVQVNEASSKLVQETRCQGEQIQFGNIFYKKNIDTSFVLKNKVGCDSNVMLKFKFLKKDTVKVEKTLCSGAFLTVNGVKYDVNKASGTELLTNKNGCDSIVLVKLTFNGSGGLTVDAQGSSKFAGFGVSCNGIDDGEAKAVISGGTAPFDITWSNGSKDVNLFGLKAGTYKLTVTDAGGCSGIDEVILKEPKRLDIYAKAKDPTCYDYKDGGIIVDSIVGGAKGYVFSLDGGKKFTSIGAIPFQISNLAQGAYSLIVEDVNDCQATFKLNLVNPPKLKLDLGPDQTVEAGTVVTLNPVANFNIYKFKWLNTKYFNCDTCIYPKVLPLLTQTYPLDIFDKNGCYATDAITLYAYLVRRVYIPNAFSPNVDGSNDKIRIFCGEGVVKIHDFRIFDRWGNMVFEDGDYTADDSFNHGWDGTFRGKVCNNAVFAYSVKVEFNDGKIQVFEGDVSIIK
jgi:gliding motility-associated-like protein